MNLSDVIGCLILLCSISIPFVFKVFEKSGIAAVVVYFVSLILHVFLVFYTVINSSAWMNDDANRLFNESLDIALYGGWHMELGAGLYGQFLAMLNSLFGVSLVLPISINIILFSLSSAIFLKMNLLLNEGRYQAVSLAFFSFSIMTLMMTSQLMRESYQLFFLMLFFYFMLEAHFYHHKLAVFFVAIITLVMLGSSHKMLLGYAMVLFLGMFLWRFDSRRSPISIFHVFCGLVFYFMLQYFFLFVEFEIRGVEALKSVFTGDLVSVVNGYRHMLPPGRTSYEIYLDSSSFLSLVSSFVKVIIYYFFMPFPWYISSLSDLYAFLEMVLRSLLIYFSVVEIKYAQGQNQRFKLMLFLSYLVLNIFFSLGVGNYGTALRHFVISEWMLLLIGGCRLWRFFFIFFRVKKYENI